MFPSNHIYISTPPPPMGSFVLTSKTSISTLIYMLSNSFVFSTQFFLSIFFLFAASMDPSALNLEFLTLADERLTLNLATNSEVSPSLYHCLIGWILADKQIKFAYFSERMASTWKLRKCVTIVKCEEDRYLFQFHHKMDAAKILDEELKLCDNFHIVVNPNVLGVVPHSVSLNYMDMWVQVHGLPFGFIQRRVGQGIC